MPAGRPKSQKQSRAVLIRFPEDEYQEVETAANADDRKLAPFIRLLVKRQLSAEKEGSKKR